VSLISVAGELLIVGTTQHDIVPLGKLSDAEQIKRVLADHSADTGRKEDRLWSPWWRPMGAAPSESSPTIPPPAIKSDTAAKEQHAAE
jgi:hypothetical protein